MDETTTMPLYNDSPCPFHMYNVHIEAQLEWIFSLIHSHHHVDIVDFLLSSRQLIAVHLHLYHCHHQHNVQPLYSMFLMEFVCTMKHRLQDIHHQECLVSLNNDPIHLRRSHHRSHLAES